MNKLMENKTVNEKIADRRIIRIINMRPGGNDTALIAEKAPGSLERKRINDEVMRLYPNIEQVGYVDPEPAPCRLTMSGGEFCGNATRSTAYLALRGMPGEIDIQVSGVAGTLKAGVATNGEAYAQMPVYREPDRVVQDPENPGNSVVYMEGITQYVNWDTSAIEGKSTAEIKEIAGRFIREKGLDTYPAAGVMYVKQGLKGLEIAPVVYVRDIDTLFYETACGSGTTAVGLTLAKQRGGTIENVPVYQPSGLPIKVSVEYDGRQFGTAKIQGLVQRLGEGVIVESEKDPYVIEQLETISSLNRALEGRGLIRAYDVFKQAPYFEVFSDDEVRDIFRGYLNKGKLFLARTADRVIGFGAAIPLSEDKNLEELAISCGLDTGNMWYMADLGVVPERRREKVATQLVNARLVALPEGTVALMRTSVDNTASQTIYRSLGFETVEGMEQEVFGKRTDGTVRRDKRIFLTKKI